MTRHDWIFKYSVAEILKAAQSRANYHQERRKFWKKESQKAEKELREHGVEFRDYQVTGGSRLEVKADPGLLNRYEEAKKKVDGHLHKFLDYERYVRALQHELDNDRSGPKLELTFTDLEFFNL